jgi:hypothetical protein
MYDLAHPAFSHFRLPGFPLTPLASMVIIAASSCTGSANVSSDFRFLLLPCFAGSRAWLMNSSSFSLPLRSLL